MTLYIHTHMLVREGGGGACLPHVFLECAWILLPVMISAVHILNHFYQLASEPYCSFNDYDVFGSF